MIVVVFNFRWRQGCFQSNGLILTFFFLKHLADSLLVAVKIKPLFFFFLFSPLNFLSSNQHHSLSQRLYRFLLLFSRSVMSDSLWPFGLHHASLSCPSLSHGVCLRSCPLNWWCHSSRLILCRPLLLLSSIFPSIRVFSSESALCISWPKDWSLSFSTSPSNEYSGLINFRIDWFELLPVQGTLKSFLQHNSKALILQCSAFFMVQLSHPYTTIGKIIALAIRTFVGKVMSLLLNTLSRFVIAFLPRSKCLLNSWLQSLSTVILEPKKIKSLTVSIFFPIYLPWCDGTGCHDLSFLNVEFFGKDWGQEENGTTEEEMVGWHHRLNGHEFG